MKLIIGLGNPGAKYKGTRHNIGFITVDEFAYQENLEFNQTLFDATFTQTHVNGEKVILMKPLTYMNLSGQAVLPVGKIRLRQKGSAGGHNGIKSIISCLGSDQFNRIKIGVGRPAPGRSVVNHVLANFEKEEQEEILASVDKSVEALRDWIKGDNFIQTMNRYN